MNLSRHLLLCVAVALVASSPLLATSYLVPSDADLVRSADAILIGTAVSSRSFQSDGTILTSYDLVVEEVLKGAIVSSRVTVTELGGLVDGRAMAVPGTPVYQKGERSLVFLQRLPDSSFRTWGMALGKFDEALAGGDVGVLVRGMDGHGIIGFSEAGKVHSERVRSESGFLSFVRDQVAGVERAVDYLVDAQIQSGVSGKRSGESVNAAPPASAYTLRFQPGNLPGRWAGSFPTLRTNGTQSGVPNSLNSVTNAVNTWNSNQGINLVYSGNTTGAGVNTNDTESVVVFNVSSINRPNCSGAGIIGCTQLGGGTTHQFKGENFVSITNADIEIASGVSGQAALDSVLAHEMGHVVGLRHADCVDGTPCAINALMQAINSPNSLRAWDVLAASSVYGANPICPSNFIASHPQNQTLPPGGSVQLSITGVSEQIAPSTFQWYRGASGDTSDPIAGATGSSLQTSSPGTYWVQVRNGCDTVQNSNAATVTGSSCDGLAITSHPQSQTIQSGQTATLSVGATGTDPKTYEWREVVPGGSSPAPGFRTGAQYTTPALTAAASYFVVVTNCGGSVNSNTATISVGSACANPVITQQPANVNVGSGQRATFSVAATGTAPLTYQWYVGPVGNTSNPVGTNSNSYTTGPLTSNVTVWVRVGNACPGGIAANSANATATVTFTCDSSAPQISAPPTAEFNASYNVTWTAAQGDTQYDVQESTSENFTSGVTTRTVATTSSSYNHSVAAPTSYFYRVRARRSCNGILSDTAFSQSTRVVVNPVVTPQPPPLDGVELTVPIDSTAPAQFQFVLLPPAGVPEAQFTATTIDTWLSVSPTSGTVRSGGVILTVTAQASMLPVGSSTSPVLINFTFADKGLGLHGSATAAVPVGVGKVPPVSSTPKGRNVPNNALIFPAVAQVEGLGASFVSDVRLANTSSQAITYVMQFTPSGTNALTSGKQSLITVPPGGIIALNNIVKQFFGLGAIPGEGAKGVLEVRPQNFANKSEDSDARAAYASVGSSRTYAKTEQGTFGQFIPGISFDRFLGKTTNTAQPNRLSLQQIAQSPSYRTNLGIVEGSGEAATVRIQVFNTQGSRLDEHFIQLQPGEHRQIDQYLATRGITLPDGRIEVEVTSDTGRVSAYASVLDNATSDPLLVEPARIGEVQARKFIVPGIADIKTGTASWRSDLRIFNPTVGPVNATLRFYPAGAPGNPISRNVTIGANQILAMDNLLETTFQTTGTGAIHVETPNVSQLIVTARTYDQRPAGTYGQFIPAVTSADSAAVGDRPLQVLQLEQSDRFRSNLGLVETEGQSVTVEISTTVPGRAAAPVRLETLAPNEFRQLNSVLALMGVPNAFNARITIRVVGGAGKLAAYGSVVDNLTQDPTYVPSQ